MLWLILTIIAVVSCYYNWLHRPHQYWKNMGMFYIKPTIFVGNMWRSLKRDEQITKTLDTIYHTTKAKGAKCVGLYRFLEPLLMVTDIELIKKITVKDFNHFIDHMRFIDDEVDPLFGRNVFALRGKEWREMRNTLSPAFTTSKMRSMYPLICECANNLANFYLDEASSTGEILKLEMKDVFTRYANDVIATASFGYNCDSIKERDNTFYLMGKEACDFTGLKAWKFTANTVSPTLTKWLNIKVFNDDVSSFFRNLIVDAISYREKEGLIRPDMIHLLMEARKGQLKNDDDSSDVAESLERKMDLSDDDITSQALMFFLAGFDTSSTLMCYVAYELAVNPDLQARLQEEVDTVMAECRGQVSYDVVMKMAYLDMIVCETLRKWPPSIVTDRMCVKPYALEPTGPGQPSVTIPAGTALWIPTFSIHRDPAYFPDPERFDPERFSPENRKNIDPYAYIPFGIGPRNCIGSRFALMETKTLFVNLISKFDFVVIDKTLVPIKLCKKSFNLNVEGGMWLGLRPRKTVNKF